MVYRTARSVVERVHRCPVCSEVIERGTGRYRIGDDEFHVSCFDRRRREVDEEWAGPLGPR